MSAAGARRGSSSGSYEFVESVTSDLSFVARGESLDATFAAAAEALLAATVADPGSVRSRKRLRVRIEAGDVELLLLQFLSELVYRRDAEALLLRAERIAVHARGRACLRAELVGEPLDPARHALETEVKAVTAYGLRVGRTPEGWEAMVTVDV